MFIDDTSLGGSVLDPLKLTLSLCIVQMVDHKIYCFHLSEHYKPFSVHIRGKIHLQLNFVVAGQMISSSLRRIKGWQKFPGIKV